jgi:hypothetical protein
MAGMQAENSAAIMVYSNLAAVCDEIQTAVSQVTCCPFRFLGAALDLPSGPLIAKQRAQISTKN